MSNIQQLIILGNCACNHIYNELSFTAINHTPGFPCHRPLPHPANMTTENMGNDIFGNKLSIHAQLRQHRMQFFGGEPSIEQHSRWCKKLGFGTCDDFAVIAYNYLSNIKKSSDIHIGKVRTEVNYDHTFLLLDFKPILAECILGGNTFKKELKSTVVCDPWANLTFSASDNFSISHYFRLMPQFNHVSFLSGILIKRQYPKWTEAETEFYLS